VSEQGPPPDPLGDRAYRRRFRDKGNKREDWAIDVFREVFANLADPARVDRLLFDLGRYYNALTDGPIVELGTRRRVMELLAAGDTGEARRLLEACLDRYRGGIDDGLGQPDAD
jgi:hypothetical protein